MRTLLLHREAERAEVRASGLVERLAAMAGRRLPSLSPQQLAETLDALARLQYEAPASFLQVRAFSYAAQFSLTTRQE
jgi:hypothetical protein